MAGIPVDVAYFESPVGIYEIMADEEGITSIKMIKENEKQLIFNSDCPNSHLADCLKWMQVYFTDLGKISKCKMPALNTTKFKHKKFCRKVWKVVGEQIKPGQTISYSDVAKLMGNPKAARAVGMAMKSNPLSIIMPCHRVVSKNGIGFYSSLNGIKTKEWLLQHEKVDTKKIGN
ncbi:methylated-DNA--protein-cysteine methyltransferase [Nematostella vectensis]|uniref:methylated-DNA--protein-cysteine methyltransferase-like n=1 Tax=Nematostella vectensis TaxID=45351 RepID=UPI0020778651|nr:methylated-DNA--protein-cysteine methyltransferase-like [Nematostella vectensis]XP_048584923.1 methylated-DNA--protein-cysteine methyltransferase [Nematostella vectensis]